MTELKFLAALHVDLLRHDRMGVTGAPHELFQTSTIQALLGGAFDGDVTLNELLEHGDLGLGTLERSRRRADRDRRAGLQSRTGLHPQPPGPAVANPVRGRRCKIPAASRSSASAVRSAQRRWSTGCGTIAMRPGARPRSESMDGFDLVRLPIEC